MIVLAAWAAHWRSACTPGSASNGDSGGALDDGVGDGDDDGDTDALLKVGDCVGLSGPGFGLAVDEQPAAASAISAASQIAADFATY